MNKDELRPVEWTEHHNATSRGGVETKAYTETIKGHFHTWRKSVFENGDEEIQAVVEDSKGNVCYIEAYRIKFLDRIEKPVVELN